MDVFEAFLWRTEPVRVLDTADAFTSIDLSVSSPLKEQFSGNAVSFEAAIESYLEQQKAKVAFGGYLEHRNLYKRSTIFNQTGTEDRNIHIGIDLWIKAGTNVLAALEGTVHSFANNIGLGNYGPTIILKHESEFGNFHSLYGHLSLESLENLESGAKVRKGQVIGTLGVPKVNGDYAPHLHFQLIRDIGIFLGDYPGVCSKNNIDYYRKNCPDPNLLLKLK